ncbi:helix-turn-helix domain-containing protein [Ekhidna sp. MALMAid0563]|uniref:helix-turn-helix domain-containing protein n=1 Tax=Ekhidna sp. MALMAid0563 TaxID=3143937 RepID=UPI0032DFC7C1
MSSKSEIVEKLTRIVERHLADENFGVTELAEEMAISKSTLLRTIKKHTSLSVNQFIKDIRLEHAKVKLNETQSTVAEIAFETGFGSPSYFIKCFKEKYGYSPGEQRNGSIPEEDENDVAKGSFKWKWVVGGVGIVSVILIALVYFPQKDSQTDEFYEKSIAVLPFKNESSDSSNLYFVNGMMESILNHLQKIEDLKVISRTSVEKYRSLQMTTPEIAKELGVSYIVEGSGQKLNNEILLTVQLISAVEDRHLWSEQYKRDISNVFAIQASVSQRIAESIKAIVSPEEQNRIEANPTENMEAYDVYLKGMEFLNLGTDAGLDSALNYYSRAIQLDKDFANAYAYSAICFYYKDFFKSKKTYLDELETYADKALLLNAELPEALIAKGMYYMQVSRYEEATEYFEKVLKYNPNSAWTHNFLSEIYNLYLMDTEKYLIHSLSALQLDLGSTDSIELSNTYLILANAFSQSGMMDKAKEHIEISLDYNSENVFSNYLVIYIDLARGLDLETARSRMINVWNKDTTRLDVLKELAKICYVQRDYEASNQYFSRFLREKSKYGYNIFPAEDITMAFVFRESGRYRQADSLRNTFEKFTQADESIYQPLHYTFLHLYDGNIKKALSSFKTFGETEDYMYWILLMFDGDPLFEDVKDNPEFKSTWEAMSARFEARKREKIKKLKEMELW